jgi:hypothetical protein
MSESRPRSFNVGERVRIMRHWEFPDGVAGTISQPEPFNLELAKVGEWDGHRRTCKLPKGLFVFYYVVFDEPTSDGSSDGRYLGAEIEADCLELISNRLPQVSAIQG